MSSLTGGRRGRWRRPTVICDVDSTFVILAPRRGSAATIYVDSCRCGNVRGARRPKRQSPETSEDVADVLAFALRFQGRERILNADEIMAEIVA
jgi:hypothetical protein